MDSSCFTNELETQGGADRETDALGTRPSLSAAEDAFLWKQRVSKHSGASSTTAARRLRLPRFSGADSPQADSLVVLVLGNFPGGGAGKVYFLGFALGRNINPASALRGIA